MLYFNRSKETAQTEVIDPVDYHIGPQPMQSDSSLGVTELAQEIRALLEAQKVLMLD